MRDQLRKHEDDLPATHPDRLDTGKIGRESSTTDFEPLVADVPQLVSRLRVAAEGAERTKLLNKIQQSFGNAFATSVVEAFQGSPKPPAAGGTVPGEGNDK